MLMLAGATIVLRSRLLDPGTLVIDGDRIVDLLPGRASGGAADDLVDLTGLVVVPGFIDVHIHGISGDDVLDEGWPVDRVASKLPQFGVTSFSPTSVACDPAALRGLIGAVRRARVAPDPMSARVLGAHLESNFINPAYRGAQPAEMLRAPGDRPAADFAADAILAEIHDAAADVAIVTLAPEIPGCCDLTARLTGAGLRVSLGHSGATHDEALAALEAGASQATHLFNRMPPLGHREPGLAGAMLADGRAAVEVICDGHHVHSAMIRTTLAAKGADRVMVVTDGTAGAGLPDGATVTLGGRPITVRSSACFLADGTLAGSATTFDAAFRFVVERVGCSLVDAVRAAATTPAHELGLADRGALEPGLLADLVALDRSLQVRQTWVGGRRVFPRF